MQKWTHIFFLIEWYSFMCTWLYWKSY